MLRDAKVAGHGFGVEKADFWHGKKKVRLSFNDVAPPPPTLLLFTLLTVQNKICRKMRVSPLGMLPRLW